MRRTFLFFAVALASNAQFRATSSVEAGISVVHLADVADGTEVDIVPEVGNRAIAFRVHGKNILYVPEQSLAEFQKQPGLNGIPLLAPWANRLDGNSYWVGSTKHTLEAGLHNFDFENHHLPIHGLLTHSPYWKVVALKADADSATVTSTLSFAEHPDLLRQWPFEEEYRMTYRLTRAGLQVQLSIANHSQSAVPVAVGFHPYYRIPDHPRDEWVLAVAARREVVTDERLIPTGETKPLSLPNPLPLRNRQLDNGFTDLERDAQGMAHFAIRAGSEEIGVLFDPQYPVAILWEPPARSARDEFVCIEPMSAVTDALNLAHAGKYKELQTIAPGAEWTGSFFIQPKGL